MQGIYTYIPETNYVPREYSVAAVLLLLFMVLISSVSVLNLLYFYISTFRSMCEVPNMAVFCSSFTSCFPGMLLTYFLNDFEIVPVAPIITGITFVFTFHMRCISIVRSLYFRIFSASFLIIFLSPEIATSINIHVPFSLSGIIMSGLFWGLLLLLLLQLSCHSVAVILTLVQTKQIIINTHSGKSFDLFLINQATRRVKYLSWYIDSATGWTTNETGVDFRQGREMYSLLQHLLPTDCHAFHTSYNLGARVNRPEREPNHLPSSLRSLRICGSIPPLTLQVFTVF